MVEYEWPLVGGKRPVWTGRGFIVESHVCPVLDCGAGESGWSEDLTQFHEDVAGEGRHPIDVASRRRARNMLRRWVHTRPDQAVILEVGCATGFLVRELIEDWPDSFVIGADYISRPLVHLARLVPGLPLLRFDLVKCPLPSQSVDAIVLLNVLEHIEDDRAAISQAARVLKSGATMVIEVPSGPHLYDVYDKYLRHFRRYRLDDLCCLVEQVGLRVVERSHLGFFVYPAFAMVKRRNRRALDSPEHVQRALVGHAIASSSQTPLLKWTTAVEEALGRWIRYPIGIRCIVAAVKP